MKLRTVIPLLVLGLAAGCSEAASGSTPESTAETPAVLIGRMDASVVELAARPEHGAAALELQQLLIGIAGAPGLAAVTRTPDEAHLLAATLYSRALSGEDFDTLVRSFTDDRYTGLYELTAGGEGGPESMPRSDMVRGVGDLACRLEVGEVGVVPYYPEVSTLGFHVVKRSR